MPVIDEPQPAEIDAIVPDTSAVDPAQDPLWYKDAVIYELHIKAFFDANGDGKLSQDELFARTPAVGNSVLPSDLQAGRQSAYFQRLDVDKDGQVFYSAGLEPPQ